MKEAISSIHIEAGNISVVKHNDRSIATVNAIFKDEVNEYDISGVQAMNKFHNFLKPRIEAYSNRTCQKLNKRTITHLSTIVNLKKDTSMVELRQLANYLEYILGTKVFQIAIHRDEGHIKDSQNIKNYHAHIEMLGIDQDGCSIRRKLTPKILSILQDKTAEILKMQRGINYAKEKKKPPRRLGTYEYKEYKKREEKVIEAVKKELTEQLNDVTSKLKVVTEQKHRVDTALIELLPQLELNTKKGIRYSYDQIKYMVLDKFNELNNEINQLKKENKTYVNYLQNAKKMYLDLKQKNTDLSVALQNTSEELKSSFSETCELKKQIESLESNKTSNGYKNVQREDDDEGNIFKFDF